METNPTMFTKVAKTDLYTSGRKPSSNIIRASISDRLAIFRFAADVAAAAKLADGKLVHFFVGDGLDANKIWICPTAEADGYRVFKTSKGSASLTINGPTERLGFAARRVGAVTLPFTIAKNGGVVVDVSPLRSAVPTAKQPAAPAAAFLPHPVLEAAE